MIRAILLSISHIDFKYPTEDFFFCRDQDEQNLRGCSIVNFLILVVKRKKIDWDIYPKNRYLCSEWRELTVRQIWIYDINFGIFLSYY